MTTVETQELRTWIGRTKEDADIITPRLAQSYRATLAPFVSESELLMPGLHWCLSPPIEATGDLGADGHPRTGDFLPPVPLPRRMWAGGDQNRRQSVRCQIHCETCQLQ